MENRNLPLFLKNRDYDGIYSLECLAERPSFFTTFNGTLNTREAFQKFTDDVIMSNRSIQQMNWDDDPAFSNREKEIIGKIF